MRQNEMPYPAGDAAEQGKGQDFNHNNFTTNGEEAQGRIFDLLPEGESEAIPASQLAVLAGYKNERALRLAVDRERVDFPLLASDRGYFRPQAGKKGLEVIRAFVRRQDSRMKSNRQTVRACKRILKASEKLTLDGQETMWGGDDT